MTTAAPPDTDDPPMATACPMQLIAGIRIKEFRNQEGTIVDRRIQLSLDCGCKYDISLDLTIPAPRPGEPSHCRMAHGPFQAEEPA